MKHRAVAHWDVACGEVVVDSHAVLIEPRWMAPPPGGAAPNYHGGSEAVEKRGDLVRVGDVCCKAGRTSLFGLAQSEPFQNTSIVDHAGSMLVLLMLVSTSWSCCDNRGSVSPWVHATVLSFQG